MNKLKLAGIALIVCFGASSALAADQIFIVNFTTGSVEVYDSTVITHPLVNLADL